MDKNTPLVHVTTIRSTPTEILTLWRSDGAWYRLQLVTVVPDNEQVSIKQIGLTSFEVAALYHHVHLTSPAQMEEDAATT